MYLYIYIAAAKNKVYTYLKILAALAFYAHRSYQCVTGISTYTSMCQGTVSKYILSTTNLIFEHLMGEIRFPETVECMLGNKHIVSIQSSHSG